VSGGNLKARPSSVNAVAVMVKEDQVDAGIVYVSVANQFNIKLVEVFSQELTGEIIFGVGIIKSGNQEWARKFREFVDRHIEEFVKWGWRSYE
jgi:molybdate transport system substrate-binding protein